MNVEGIVALTCWETRCSATAAASLLAVPNELDVCSEVHSDSREYNIAIASEVQGGAVAPAVALVCVRMGM